MVGCIDRIACSYHIMPAILPSHVDSSTTGVSKACGQCGRRFEGNSLRCVLSPFVVAVWPDETKRERCRSKGEWRRESNLVCGVSYSGAVSTRRSVVMYRLVFWTVWHMLGRRSWSLWSEKGIGLRTVLLRCCELFVWVTFILVVEWDPAFLLLVPL